MDFQPALLIVSLFREFSPYLLEDLCNYFKKYSSFYDFSISRDRDGWTKGFGYLKLKSVAEIDQILADDHKIFGKIVRFVSYF